MSSTRCWIAALAVALGLSLAAAPHLLAQTIPAEITQASAPLNEAQLRTLDNYMDPLVQQLTQSKDDAQIADARRKLGEPYGMNGTPVFTNSYSNRLSGKLAAAQALATENRPAVRINALIVVSDMTDASALPLIEQGLADSSPGVRFWAARAAQRLGDKNLNDADRRRLLEMITPALKGEKAQQVVEELLRTFSKINIREAADRLMEVLNDRVNEHAADPKLPIAAENAALRDQFRTMVTDAARNQSPPPGLVKATSRAAVRYMTLAVNTLTDPNFSGTGRADLAQSIELGDTVLRWSVDLLAKPRAAGAPADFKLDIQQGNWQVVKLKVLDWQAFLQKDPAFGFTADQLKVGN